MVIVTERAGHAYDVMSSISNKELNSYDGTPASKTLSWHLASETKSTLKGTSHGSTYGDDPKFSAKTSGVFHLLDNEESARVKSLASQIHLSNGGLAFGTTMQTLGVTRRMHWRVPNH
ncbi:hypothetical protein L6164_002856 [Bauhinia variegata]|uniref:Uncharacterized protein n=1 Tax=Bauhinia variegata TaxID=167791 RepID=A0ACB9PYX6_BAUVA|nr:hypothetical protein L6164_002856 [Bauhinia variegata]